MADCRISHSAISVNLGAAEWLVSDRFSNTIQLTENLTKIYGSHTFKAGVEYQNITFPWIAPPYSRGEFDFHGTYTSIPGVTDGSVGAAQMLLTPMASTVGGPNFVGGADSINVSNFGGVSSKRSYWGGFVQDDWKVNSKLTLNLGLRWEWFSPTGERYNAQANFVPGNPFSGAEFLIPTARQNNPALSASFNQLLAQDGINLVYTNQYGSGLVSVQDHNFAPRIGIAYKASPRTVVRAGYGIYYGAFENRGGYPSLGYNYPFQYSFNFPAPDPGTPIQYSNGAYATLETGLTAIPLNPTASSGIRSRSARNSAALQDAVLPKLQLHRSTSNYADFDRASWIRRLPCPSSGNVPRNQRSERSASAESQPSELRAVPGLLARIAVSGHNWNIEL